jgi:hypothetical protein
LSRTDPVTLYGAKLSSSGWANLEPTFHTVASWFSDSVEYEFEVIAAGASGDLAYTVGYERNKVNLEGEPRTYTLRATHVTGARTDSGASCTGTPTSHPPTTTRAPSEDLRPLRARTRHVEMSTPIRWLT